jgi:hypothetical protein
VFGSLLEDEFCDSPHDSPDVSSPESSDDSSGHAHPSAVPLESLELLATLGAGAGAGGRLTG